MQTLVKAKRDNDVITLIRLFSTYVPDAQYVLDENSQRQITHLFEMKTRELNRDHRDLFHHQGMKSQIWKQFSASSQKNTQQKIHSHINEIGRGLLQIINLQQAHYVWVKNKHPVCLRIYLLNGKGKTIFRSL